MSNDADMVSFWIGGKPKTWKRPRFNRKTGGVYTAAQDKTWRESVWGQSYQHAPDEPYEGPLEVTLIFYLPIAKSWPQWKKRHYRGKLAVRRRDIDNLAKAVLDALKGVFFEDDDQVCELHLQRRYEAENGPGVEVHITAHEPLPEKMCELSEGAE